MIDLDLIAGMLLVVALAYVVYRAIPMLAVTEPFLVYKTNDPEHRQILPPNPGLGSLDPRLLPLDKQNADMRGPHAYNGCGKTQGSYPLSPIMEEETKCLQSFSN